MSITNEKLEIYVCTNVDCKSRGSQETIDRLRAQLRNRGMNDVSIESIICFSACNVGPNVVIPSKRCWLSGVTKDKVETVIDYLNGPVDITELQKGNDPVLDQMIFEMIDAGLLEKADPT
jgi:(2Fe-2S) ferredoxin